MPLSAVSRQFLTSALVHLAAAGAVLLLGSGVGALTVRWDFLLWLLLIGFVGFTTAGFALHLFPTIARRPQPPPWVAQAAFLLAEGGLVLGAVGLSEATSPPIPGWVFSLGAMLFLGGVGTVSGLFAYGLFQPRVETPGPEARPGDAVTVPLFLASWASAVSAGGMFVLSGFAEGPGYGWWLGAVHLFVLGHVILLITAVSLRLVPRFLGADVSRPLVYLLAGLAIAGAILVPSGMLATPPLPTGDIVVFAAPEAAFGILFVSMLIILVRRARTRRAEAGLHLMGATFFLVGGAIGLWMVSESNYTLVIAHALVNVLGFVGLMILAMWFGMIAPFQRISHAWTRRMLWALSVVWVAGVAAAATAGARGWVGTSWLAPFSGAILLGVAIAWGVGTVPVLYRGLNPLPGLTSEEIRTIRERWSSR
ncbi:MAG TPA: hypothetical protein VMV28_06935 [Thermoplasmata archaeon]|nr:hypothetical protein [Thermoplasmata archaeon]